VRTPAKQTCYLLFALLLNFAHLGCSGEGSKSPAATLNHGASPVGTLPTNPLTWQVIMSEVDKQNGTMSTLYGNEIAVAYARTNAGQKYPVGSKLALVTWTRREDDRWFGAKIPGQVKSVEFVFAQAADATHPPYSYDRYEGTPLNRVPPQDLMANERTAYLLSQRAAVMP
jgi:cytochrome P460